MHTIPTNLTLAEIATAQQKGNNLGFEQDFDQCRLEHLRASYATKREQRNMLYQLFDESAIEIVIRVSGGRELVLPVSEYGSGDIFCALRDYQDQHLQKLERLIVEHLLGMQEEVALPPSKTPNYASAILALCTPAISSGTTPVAEAPTSLPVLPAGQRLFATPPTRSSAASAINSTGH
jgi:hypothetical protein